MRLHFSRPYLRRQPLPRIFPAPRSPRLLRFRPLLVLV
uniref:Protein ROOT INITIATION DEFECTIVE 3-like n=1 Tax=Rhizophora mucronata TaxID=61149 RepID=A0A2P2KS75_RHIMU